MNSKIIDQPFSEGRESHLHCAFIAADLDRKINEMQFSPFSPESSYISGNPRPSNGEHTYEDTEPKRENLCGICVHR